MPANVQSMFYVGKMPWHKEGTALNEPPDTITAIKTAGLDWSVKKVKVFSQNGMEIKNYYGVERSDTGKILGIVKNNYVPLQNTEAFVFFDPFVTNNFLEYETAGALGDGEIVWILAKIKDNGSFAVQSKDEIVKYLLLSNSHDGESAVNIKFTPIRVVCQNTLNAALDRGKTLNVKHLAGMHAELFDIQEVIKEISGIYTHIESIYNKMANRRVNNKKVNAYFNLIYPVNDIKRGMTKNQKNQIEVNKKIRQCLMNNFENGLGVKELKIGGTLWAAYNAVTQYIDHPENYKLGDNKLLKRIWFGEGEAIKKKAYLSAVKFLSAV